MRLEMSICDDYGISHNEFLTWDSDDQDLALAYRIYKAEHCARCGTSEEEWEHNNFAYEPEVRRCRGCEMQQLVEEDLATQKGTAGMYVVMKKATPVPPPKKLKTLT